MAITGTIGVGASGVVFGYLGYVLVKGFFDRHGIDIMIGAVMALCFAYQFTVLLPKAGIGWQAHIGGLVGGLAGGWIFRDRAAARPAEGAAGRSREGSSPASAGTGTTSALPTGTSLARPVRAPRGSKTTTPACTRGPERTCTANWTTSAC